MPGALRCFKVGDALVVHREDADVPELEAFAARLAPDPGCAVVVLGGGADRPGDQWRPVLPVLAAEARDVRLVPGLASVTTSVQLGRWLAARLGRAVLAHDGQVLPAAHGALFVPPAQGAGWMWLGSGQEHSSGSRRFPSPGWTSAILECDMLTEAAVAEPLPAGAWIRPQAGAGADRCRQELVSRLAWSDDRVYVVLGCPGAPPVAAADVEAFWRLLPLDVRAVARFVPYGDVAVPEGQTLGVALAGWLGEDVTACTEVPWSTEEPPPLAPGGGNGTPDQEADSTEPEMVAAASVSRPSADEVSPGPGEASSGPGDEEPDEDTLPLPVLRRRQPAGPVTAPTPPPPVAPSATRLDGGPDGEVPVPLYAEDAAEGRRRNPSRRMLYRMRWPAVAAAACLAVAVSAAVLALRPSTGPTRILAAAGPVVTPAGQTIAPTGTPTPSATATNPRKPAAKVGKVPAVEDTAAAHATRRPGVNTGDRVVSAGGGSRGDGPAQGSSSATSSGSNAGPSSSGEGSTGSVPPSAPAETTPPSTGTAPSSGSFAVSGEVSCVSGNSVEGVWVQADDGAGWAPWVGLGNGSTSTWSFTLPEEEAYSLHIGCGGTTASWAVADYSPAITTATSDFNCIDVSSDADYGDCDLR